MAIRVACKGCGAKLNAKDELAGKKVKCPSCGAPIRLPGAGASGSGETSKEAAPAKKPRPAEAGAPAAERPKAAPKPAAAKASPAAPKTASADKPAAAAKTPKTTKSSESAPVPARTAEPPKKEAAPAAAESAPSPQPVPEATPAAEPPAIAASSPIPSAVGPAPDAELDFLGGGFGGEEANAGPATVETSLASTESEDGGLGFLDGDPFGGSDTAAAPAFGGGDTPAAFSSRPSLPRHMQQPSVSWQRVAVLGSIGVVYLALMTTFGYFTHFILS